MYNKWKMVSKQWQITTTTTTCIGKMNKRENLKGTEDIYYMHIRTYYYNLE